MENGPELATLAVLGALGLAYVVRSLSYGGRVEQYTKLISEAPCPNCYQPFGREVAVASICEEDTAMDGRQLDSNIIAPGIGHISTGYRFNCLHCGRRSCFRVADHRIILLPKTPAT